jgi:primase-polymerase (primpol)-like protein
MLTEEEIVKKNKEYVEMFRTGQINTLTGLQILMDADEIPKWAQKQIMYQAVKYLRGE